MIMDLKNINCGEKLVFLQLVAKISTFAICEKTAHLFKREKKCYLKQSVAKNITNFTDFRQNGVVFMLKIMYLK